VKIFGSKTAQLCATRCESRMDKLPSVSNDVQRRENKRKDSFLNYKSAVPQASIPTGERSGLQTHIVATESGSLCERMKS
jgi:hypothetical protein